MNKVTTPPLILNFKTMADIQSPNYNYKLIARGLSDKAVVGWLKTHGYGRVLGDAGYLHELAEKISKDPAQFRELYYLMDRFHEEQ